MIVYQNDHKDKLNIKSLSQLLWVAGTCYYVTTTPHFLRMCYKPTNRDPVFVTVFLQGREIPVGLLCLYEDAW